MRVKEAVIVEGRYDRERLLSLVDGIVVETRGFRIFKDEKQRAYIKKLAEERGIIILTDSDSAGFLIRNHLKSFVPESQVKNAYIPKIEGKEKRKRSASKEGILGVEGQEAAAILTALERAGAGVEQEQDVLFSTADLFCLGLSGGPDSKRKRERFLAVLGLPVYLSTKDLLKYMNRNQAAVQPLLQKMMD